MTYESIKVYNHRKQKYFIWPQSGKGSWRCMRRNVFWLNVNCVGNGALSVPLKRESCLKWCKKEKPWERNGRMWGSGTFNKLQEDEETEVNMILSKLPYQWIWQLRLSLNRLNTRRLSRMSHYCNLATSG